MMAALRGMTFRCVVCHRPVARRALVCDGECVRTWRILEQFRANESARPWPDPLGFALHRLARGDRALVRD